MIQILCQMCPQTHKIRALEENSVMRSPAALAKLEFSWFAVDGRLQLEENLVTTKSDSVTVLWA